MKKYLLSLMLFAAVSSLALYVVSCQKEHNPANEPAINTTQPSTETSAADERVPRIQLTKIVSFCDCTPKTCNNLGAPSTGNKYNGIRTIVTSFTHNLFNVNGTGLTYTIYQGSNCSGPVIASFVCTNQTMEYVSASLQNNTTYSVNITYPGDVPVCGQATTSNCRTQPCSINQ